MMAPVRRTLLAFAFAAALSPVADCGEAAIAPASVAISSPQNGAIIPLRMGETTADVEVTFAA